MVGRVIVVYYTSRVILYLPPQNSEIKLSAVRGNRHCVLSPIRGGNTFTEVYLYKNFAPKVERPKKRF